MLPSLWLLALINYAATMHGAVATTARDITVAHEGREWVRAEWDMDLSV